MQLETIDWVIIFAFFALSVLIGVLVMKKAGSSTSEFFLSGRNMPWWLLGVSMVATTFAADTPNLVTQLVREDGVSGNWVWWAFLLTGMLTVFVYSRLWRRSGVTTDLEIYEMRYGGKAAAFLRGFRAIYLGVFFNIMIMAGVALAAIKIGSVMLGLQPWQTITIASIVTVIYSSLGGLRGVIITDFFQFAIAMAGAIGAAYVVLNLPEVGGLEGLLTNEAVQTKLDFIPNMSDPDIYLPLIIIPIAVQWWSVWYPGAEPGGGGYIAQRMLSAKNEKHAMGATLMFNVAHYALRPWPWIIVALASLIIFPNLSDIQAAFPHIQPDDIKHDLAYPAMMTYLPAGLLGLVLASLIAAFMSTISTHLNWGSSYVVNDFWKRFVKPEASERELVLVGRISTIVLMLMAAVFALFLEDAKDAFNILLQIGAGTGLIFILRWFWWRINAYTEIAGMAISFVVAVFFTFVYPQLPLPELADWQVLVFSVGITTVGWVTVTLITPPESKEVLEGFYRLVKPAAFGWKPILKSPVNLNGPEPEKGQLPLEIMAMFIGCCLVYAALFATGLWIYGNTMYALIATGIAVVAVAILFLIWKNLREIKAGQAV